jgi:hypothetical protein
MDKKLTRDEKIQKRITIAIQWLEKGDVKEASFNIAPAIDVTAKERHKDKREVGDRIRAFIFDEQNLIYYFSMQGKLPLKDGDRVVLVDKDNADKPIGGYGGELADFIYNIRCAQTHDAEIDYDNIDYGRDFGIGRDFFVGDGGEPAPGMFIISKATVYALLLSVICAPENSRIELPGNITLCNKVHLDRNKLVGNKDYLMTKLHQLFEV